MDLLTHTCVLFVTMRRHCHICSKRKFCLYGVALITCIAVEFLSFWVVSSFWHLPVKLSTNTTVILLVADPQILGQNEPTLYGWLSRWDSDRYLHRGYSHAVTFLKPHLEFFLGDIFDEGEFLDDHHFALDVERFLRIFPLHSNISRIYLAGDNDIGGEMEPVYSKIHERFLQNFQPKLVLGSNALNQLTIYKTNPENNGEFTGVYGYMRQSDKDVNSPMTIRLLLSHFPVIPHIYSKMEQELRQIHIILSGHDHTNAFYIQWRNPPELRKTAAAMDVSNAIWTLSLDDPAALPLIEFKVPTCNYRMGVPGMGYGLLMLTHYPENSTALAQFSILWLPGRFPQLAFYIIILFILPIITFTWEKIKTRTAYRRIFRNAVKNRKTKTTIQRKRLKEKQDNYEPGTKNEHKYSYTDHSV